MPMLWHLNSILAHTYGALAIIRDGSRFPCINHISTFISSYIFLFIGGGGGNLVPPFYLTDCCSDYTIKLCVAMTVLI